MLNVRVQGKRHLFCFAPPPPPVFLHPPVTNYMLLYCPFLCKKIARASGCHKKFMLTKLGGAKQNRSGKSSEAGLPGTTPIMVFLWVFPIIAPHENIAPPLWYIYHDWGAIGYLTTKLGVL